ncbi:MAG TPA: hypothetical protein VFV58_33515 [Blastocatellia bacterium]|jgi:hypothetical protein|nr:hypothetical protein [Blastocatellia bacterium]
MATFANWESQLQARANEMLARRTCELKAEIERLQGIISEIGSRLAEQDGVMTGAESSGLIEEVRGWFDDQAAKVEEDYKLRLEDAAANARREAEIQIEEMRAQLEASRALTMAVAASQSSSRSFEMFKAAIEDIDSQRTQSDTLAALVRHAAEFAPRVVFFVIKSGDAVGWKARGFENGLNDETAKLLTAPAQKPLLLRDALTNLHVAISNPQSISDGDDDSGALGPYGSPAPERAIAIPLIVLNKAVAVLYADSGAQPEDSLNTAAAESLTRIAGRTIEFLLSRRSAETARPGGLGAGAAENSPATHLRKDDKAMGAAIQQTPNQLTLQPAVQMDSVGVDSGLKPDPAREIHHEIHEDAPQIEKTNDIADAAINRVTVERRRTQELPVTFDKESQVFKLDSKVDEGLRQAEAQLPEPTHIETEPGAAPEPRIGVSEGSETTVGASGRLRFESPAPQPSLSPSEIEQQPAFGAPAVSPTPLSDFAAPQLEESPPSSNIPAFSPPPAPPIFTSPSKPLKSAQSVTSVPGSETEQRAHNDARRFARLLVSEIKLYNAAKVNDGRRNYDLYERLKDEIDRSRKVYDKRVSPTVAARFDYFYDELVQTLAEGDPAKLGKDCPGPVALA